MTLIGVKITAPKPLLTIKLFLGSTALCLIGDYFGQAQLVAYMCIAFSCGILTSASGISIAKYGNRAMILISIIVAIVYVLSNLILFGL